MWKYVTAWLYSAPCQAHGGQFPFAQPPSLSCNNLFTFFHCAAGSGFSSFSEQFSQDFFLNTFFLFTSRYRWESRRFFQCCLIHSNSSRCYLRCIGPLLYNVSLTITPKLSTILPPTCLTSFCGCPNLTPTPFHTSKSLHSPYMAAPCITKNHIFA